MPLPVSKIWDASLDFARRESSLLVPLALATLALGQASAELGMAIGAEYKATGAGLMLALGGFLLLFTGQLAIIALVLRPGMSVGEAIRLGMNRLPRMIVMGIMIAVLLVTLLLPMVVWLLSQGFDPLVPNAQIPAPATFYAILVMCGLIWLSIKLYAVPSLLVDRDVPLLTALRQSFALTRGHAVLLLGVSAVFMLVGLVLQMATESIVGFIFGLLAKSLGQPMLATAMIALGVGMAAAAIGLVTTIFSALAYRYLTEQGNM